VPLTHLPEWSIDYGLYRDCPARHERKQTRVYLDDEGNVQEWKSSSARRALSRRADQEKEKSLREEKKAIELQIKLDEKAKEEAKAQAAEAVRERNGLPALTRREAVRRCLETYLGNDCKSNHGGLRYSFNGECLECRESNKRLREAMKRGAFPVHLSEDEKMAISKIYAEARRLTKMTGVQYHVDHIKPLSKGGEHHPVNLQIITADENLSKGAKWKEPEKGAYRNQGVGRRESI